MNFNNPAIPQLTFSPAEADDLSAILQNAVRLINGEYQNHQNCIFLSAVTGDLLGTARTLSDRVDSYVEKKCTESEFTTQTKNLPDSKPEKILTAIQELNLLADKEKAEKYPNAPYRIKSKYDDRTANGLTTCVIEWIRLNGQFAARINTGGIYDEKLKKYRPSGATLGMPDVIACIQGRFVGLEIKIGSDKMSNEQKAIALHIQSALGSFIEVRSFEKFYNWYETFTRPPFL